MTDEPVAADDRAGAGEPPERPLHQRVAAVAARTGAFLGGSALGGLLLLLAEGLAGLAAWAVVTGAFGLGLFALERRDAGGGELVVRSVLAAAAWAVLGPLAWLSVTHAGDPTGAVAALEAALAGSRGPPFGVGLLAVLAAPGALLVLYVRARSDRAGALAGVLALGGLPAAVALTVAAGSPAGLLAWLVGAPVGGVAVAAVDARARAWDPLGPAPRSSPVAPALGCSVGLLVVLFLCALAATPGVHARRRHGNEAAAIGALRTIGTAQALFREGDREGDGRHDYAGNLGELGERRLVDEVLAGGRKQGYLFRVVHSATTPELRWAAAADPAIPGVTGERYFFVDHTGVVYYGTTGPAPLEPTGAATPAPGWKPVGR